MTDQHDLMVRAAWMYYADALTHAEIAHKLHLSRVKVTRLLQRARETGIVEIRVVAPMPHDLELSRQIEMTYGVGQAVVAQTPEAAARAAADTLHYLLAPNGVIGFGWSSTVRQMAAYITPQPVAATCTVVDLVGTVIGKANPYSVSGQVADALGATLLPLAVPVVVSSPAARAAMLAEPSIAQALAAARNSQLAFVGVGEVGPTSTLVDTGFLTPVAMTTLEERGAVGDLLMRYFDAHGAPVHHETDARVVGLGWEDLAAIPNVVLVAHGERKTAAIRGALRSGIVNTLITDMPTASALLSA